jgi:hypothetical protein
MLVLVTYPGSDCTENASSLVARETCPQKCFLATAIVLSPVYTAVTLQWVYMSQYTTGERKITAVASMLRLRSDAPCPFSSLFSLPTRL